MNIELKSIKRTASQSQDTHCFSASLWVDGKPIAVLENNGGGGSTDDSRHPKATPDAYKAAMDQVHAHFAQLPVQDFGGFYLQPTLELWAGLQVDEFDLKQQLKRTLKKIATVEDGNVYLYKTPKDQARVDAIIANLKAEGKTVLNTLPFDDALRLFRATAE